MAIFGSLGGRTSSTVFLNYDRLCNILRIAWWTYRRSADFVQSLYLASVIRLHIHYGGRNIRISSTIQLSNGYLSASLCIFQLLLPRPCYYTLLEIFFSKFATIDATIEDHTLEVEYGIDNALWYNYVTAADLVDPANVKTSPTKRR